MSHEVPFERSDGAAIPEHCTLSSLFMLHLFNNAGRICLVRWIFATYEVACFLLYCMQTDGNAEQMLQMYHTGVRLLLNPDGRNCALTLRRLMSYIYIYMEHLFLMFLDHTQRRSTVGRTPLDE